MFTELYKELADIITTNINEVKWVDVWKNQVSFLDSELPFPAPAVFLAFQSDNMSDLSQKQQDITMLVTAYIYYETFAESFEGSYNQDSALGFGEILTNVHKNLHGTSGTNFSSMKRIGFQPVDFLGAGLLYQQTFTCQVIDKSASQDITIVTAPLDVQSDNTLTTQSVETDLYIF